MTRVLKPAAVEAGPGEWVPDERGRLRAESWVGFHTFRHTCATSLFRAGWNAVQVQRWLGHHKPSFTIDTYVHLLEQDIPEPIAVAGGNGWQPDPPKSAETTVSARRRKPAYFLVLSRQRWELRPPHNRLVPGSNPGGPIPWCDA
jgi:Phage integrase family